MRGCIPKKLLVYSAEFPHLFEDASGYGWQVATRFDWATLIARKDREVARLSGLYKQTLESHQVRLYEQRARVTSAHSVEVGGQEIKTRYILLATGGRSETPSVPGAELGVTSDQAFHLAALPPRVTIVGGGYIGVEFAGIFAGLGSKVALVHRGDKVLRGFDEDLRTAVTNGLHALGIEMQLNNAVAAIQSAGHGVSVSLRTGGSHAADLVLFATGRKPNTANLGLEALGVKLTARGAVEVDVFSQSSVESIYAVGDCTDRMALTPVAIREGQAFADTVFGKKSTPLSHENVPTAVFARPPAASVGLTEAQARERFSDVDIYQTSFRPLFHTLSGRDEKVFIKLVVDGKSDRVVGAHMVGTAAPEIIQTVAIALQVGLRKAELDNVFALHPTTAEELVFMRKKQA